MRLFTTSGFLFVLAGSLFTTSCVTVNVQFPESAVQKATDDYVKDLYRAKDRSKPETTPSHSPASTPKASHTILDEIIPSATADETIASFNLDSPKASEIKESLRTRIGVMIALKKEGVLGETKDGFIVVAEPDKLKPLYIESLKRKMGVNHLSIPEIVAQENKDRAALYDEVLAINKLTPAKKILVQASFARSFQAESPSGTPVQNDSGTFDKKR